MSNNSNSFASDNYFDCFPARMHDGRYFTDYKSNCYMNELQKNMSTYEYRQYLKENAEKIMKNNSDKYSNICRNDYSIVNPKLKLNCNNGNCNTKEYDNNGLGLYVNH